MDRTDLTSCAVCFNGDYIEDKLEGYTTLRVRGRDVLTKEIVSNSYRNDGSVFDYSKYPERIIEVEFILDAPDVEVFRTRLQLLNQYLNLEEADFYFNDESYCFSTGSVSINEPIESNPIFLHGEYTITCFTPFKYSVAPVVKYPTIFEDNTATFQFYYTGTYPAKPILKAEFASGISGGSYNQDGDCGYVAFIDSNENIIQMGNPNIIDLDATKTATQIVNTNATGLTSWATSGGSTWGSKATGGTTATAAISDTYWSKGKGISGTFLKPTSYGSGSGWHGAMRFLDFTALTAQNFEVAIVQRLCCNKAVEVGCFEFGLYTSDSTPKMLAGIVIEKTSNGTSGTVRYIVDGKQKGTNSIDLSYYNTNFGYCKRTPVTQTQYWDKKKKKWQTKKIKGAKTRTVTKSYNYTQSNLNTSIKKLGGTYTFKVGNLKPVSYTVADSSQYVVSKATLYFGNKGTGTALNTNAVQSVKITRLAGDSFEDTQNTFTAGDIVEADCNDASIYRFRVDTEEGHYEPQLGALGNDWEDFVLTEGLNQIQAVWSPWVDQDYIPTVSIIYNEVYI